MTGSSRRSNPPERVWVRLIRVPIFDHLELDAGRPKTVLIMDIPSRAPPGADTFDMSGTQSGSRLAPAVLALCKPALQVYARREPEAGPDDEGRRYQRDRRSHGRS